MLSAVLGVLGEGEMLTAVVVDQGVLPEAWYKHFCTCRDPPLKGNISLMLE